MDKIIKIANTQIANNLPLVYIGGTCVIESAAHYVRSAKDIKKIVDTSGRKFILKASFDKANRTSLSSFRGPGMTEGLRILSNVKRALKVPVVVDVHEPWQAEEAAATYEACLSGVFANDPAIRFEAARANMEAGKFERTAELLELIRKSRPEFRPEQVSLLIARSLAQSGRHAEARAEFESAMAKFGGFDVKAEYLIWALLANERELATRLYAEVERATKRWNRYTKEQNRPMLRRLEAAYEYARQHP